jgi:hypothetical protein
MADEMIAGAGAEANSVANSRLFIGQSANRSFQDEFIRGARWKITS